MTTPTISGSRFRRQDSEDKIQKATIWAEHEKRQPVRNQRQVEFALTVSLQAVSRKAWHIKSAVYFYCNSKRGASPCHSLVGTFLPHCCLFPFSKAKTDLISCFCIFSKSSYKSLSPTSSKNCSHLFWFFIYQKCFSSFWSTTIAQLLFLSTRPHINRTHVQRATRQYIQPTCVPQLSKVHSGDRRCLH